MKVTPTILKTFLEETFGEKIVKRGNEWIVPSFAKPSKLKTYINIEKCTAIDFIGGVGYNGHELIAKIAGIEKDEVDDYLADYIMRHIRNVDLSEFKERKTKQSSLPPPPIQSIPLPDGCVDIITDLRARVARNYLHKRGLKNEDIKKYHLTFCTKGRFRNRIIIPFIENNEIIWYQGRAIYDDMFLRYDNPKGIEKSMILYNIDRVKKIAIVVEGPFDAMAVDGVAIMGSSMSDWQTTKLLAKNPEKIIIVPDNDWSESLGHSPGYVGALQSITKLTQQGYKLSNILIAEVEGGKDLSDLGKAKAFEVISNAQPFTLKTYLRFRELGAQSDEIEKMV